MVCITVIMTFNMWMPGRSFGIEVVTKSQISENISNFVHTHTKELVLHTISVVQSHYLCTVLLWMDGLRKMFENHWFRDALMWICNDLCIFLSFFFPLCCFKQQISKGLCFLFWTRQFHLTFTNIICFSALSFFMNVSAFDCSALN